MAFDYWQYEAQVANLLPGTVYNYDIFVNGVDAARRSRSTQSGSC